MNKQSLNGLWFYRIGEGKEAEKNVPFSALPVGRSVCRRKFDLEHSAECIYLILDGITYSAKVFLNGHFLGSMLPYCEYKFDITNIANKKENEVIVELEDISPAFGPTEGWENFGGIVRDVYVSYNNKAHFKDVFIYTQLADNYTSAEYTVEIDATEYDEFKVELSYEGKVVSSYITSDCMSKKSISDIKLWSTENPNLYQLTVHLLKNGRISDTYKCNVGFREIKCDRHRFIINGEPVFLNGVCKHEFFGDSGHTVTEEHMEQDMRMIKSMGCNFVRLVHYPHNKMILDIADRIGLMVCEEPGLWWSDTGNEEIAASSIEVLKRTIIRDRNHASIAFWLCFNECKFTEKFLIDSAKACKETDPTRLVSGANCMSNEDTLKYFNLCGFDFYTMHPYAPSFDMAMESARILNDKPLLFTEWGGYFVYNNPNLLTDFIKEFSRLYHSNSDDGALAGAFLWCWAEVNDFNRGTPFCVDGLLLEGLVDKYRNPRLNYNYFCDAIKNFDTVSEHSFECTPVEKLEKTALACADVSDLNKSIVCGSQFCNMRIPQIKTGPVFINEVPTLTSDGITTTFSGEGETDEITVIGATSLTKGYPVSGEYGEEAFEITIYGENDFVEKYIMKNGIDFTTAYTVLGSSKIDPHAKNTEIYAKFSYDKNFENYIVNRLDIKLSEKIKVHKVEISSFNKGYDLLTYGIFI